MNPLTFIIKPVSVSCNIACEYCYHGLLQKERKKRSVMTHETLSITLSKLMGLRQNRVRIIWHGGEPLLAGKDFYYHCLELQRDKKFINLIQTNGTLVDNEWVKILTDFKVGISIDGPKNFHDENRVSFSGKGTFDQMMRGLFLFLDSGFDIGSITVVTKNNVDNPKEIFMFLYNMGIKKMNFSPCVDEIYNSSISAIEFAKFLSVILELLVEIDDPELKVVPIDSFLKSMMGGEPSICYYKGDCTNFLSIDSNGDIYVCGRSVGDTSRLIGNIVNDDLIDLFSSDKFAMIRMDAIDTSKCGNCKWLNVCRGGCPLERNNSRFMLCDTVKTLLPKIESFIESAGY